MNIDVNSDVKPKLAKVSSLAGAAGAIPLFYHHNPNSVVLGGIIGLLVGYVIGLTNSAASFALMVGVALYYWHISGA